MRKISKFILTAAILTSISGCAAQETNEPAPVNNTPETSVTTTATTTTETTTTSTTTTTATTTTTTTSTTTTATTTTAAATTPAETTTAAEPQELKNVEAEPPAEEIPVETTTAATTTVQTTTTPAQTTTKKTTDKQPTETGTPQTASNGKCKVGDTFTLSSGLTVKVKEMYNDNGTLIPHISGIDDAPDSDWKPLYDNIGAFAYGMGAIYDPIMAQKRNEIFGR